MKNIDSFNTYDEAFSNLRSLEACNLYLSILVKCEASGSRYDSGLVFKMMNGYRDLKQLEDIYISEGSFDKEMTFAELLEKVKTSYAYLDQRNISQTTFIQDAKDRCLDFTKYLDTLKDAKELHEVKAMDFLFTKLYSDSPKVKAMNFDV